MKQIKVDIFSGFLGAGKTTLIKKLIGEVYKGEKLVLIENEFGDIGIDGGFLKDSGIEINEMNSGCICCTLVGDFEKSLEEVVNKFDPDRILIEPSGVGKLSDVIKAVENVHDERLLLNTFTAVVDAKKCKMYMNNFGEFFNDQIESAKCVILSHTKDLDGSAIDGAVELVKELNPEATIVTTDWEEILGEKIYEAMEKEVTLERMKAAAEKSARGHHYHHHHDGVRKECCGDEHHHHHENEEGVYKMDCCGDDPHHHHHTDGSDFQKDCCGGGHGHHHHHHHDGVRKECCGDEHHHHHENEEGVYKMDCCGDDPHHHHHTDGSDFQKDCCGGGHGHHHHHHHHDDECGCGHDHSHDHHGHHHADEVFDSIGVETNNKYTVSEIESILDELEDTSKYGQILRAKGIVAGDQWIHFDYIPGEADVRTGSAEVTGRIVVIGVDLVEAAIKELFKLK